MSFGKRIKKVRKDVSKDSGTVDKVSEKLSDKSNSVNSSDNGINSSGNTTDSSIKKQKIKNQRTYNFMKKSSKKKSEGLLFGMTKEEKLELFIRNTKIIHPGIPDFWLQKETDKFKKKFNIQNV